MTTILKSGEKLVDLESKIKKAVPSKKLDAKKFSGIIKMDIDPLIIQTKLRNEWG